MDDEFFCHTSVFGDPAPGEIKHCGYLNWDWNNCSQEGSYCSVSGTKLVKFGGQGRYVVTEISKGFTCERSNFEFDPLPGLLKHCEYLPYNYKWIYCTKGSTLCKFFGLSIVKFVNTRTGMTQYKEAAFEISCYYDTTCYYAQIN